MPAQMLQSALCSNRYVVVTVMWSIHKGLDFEEFLTWTWRKMRMQQALDLEP